MKKQFEKNVTHVTINSQTYTRYEEAKNIKVDKVKLTNHRQKNAYQSKHKTIDNVNKGLDKQGVNALLFGESNNKKNKRAFIEKVKAYKLEQKKLKNKNK